MFADTVETLFKLALSFENLQYYRFVNVYVWGVSTLAPLVPL